jgi:arginase
MRPVAIIEAPSILGLRPTGVERLPEALIRAGLLDRLRARHAGRVDPPPYSPERDPETGFLNPRGIAEYSRLLAERVGQVLDEGEFPLVLGGDCSILLGPMLALNRRGRYGLLFLDGHMDFYDPEANVNGEAASSELALATGRGPALLTAYDGRCPLVRDEDVAVFGFRDEREARSYGSQPLPAALKAVSLEEARRSGIAAPAREAIEHVSNRGARDFWIHFDADVLDDAVMPAVDYRQPGGLSAAETEAVLGAALAHARAAGMEITILNPVLDPHGAAVGALLAMLLDAWP